MKKVLLFLGFQKRQLKHPGVSFHKFFMNVLLFFLFNFRIIPQIKKFKKGNNLKIVTLDSDTERFLDKAGIKYISRNGINNLYLDAKGKELFGDREIRKKSFQFTDKLGSLMETECPSSFYNGSSLWGLAYARIGKDFIYPTVKFIDCCKALTKRISPDYLLILDQTNLYQQLSENIARKYGIKIIDKTDILCRINNSIKFSLIKFLMYYILMPRSLRTLKSNQSIPPFSKTRRKIIISRHFLERNKLLPWANKIKGDIIYVGMRPHELDSKTIKYVQLSEYANDSVRSKIKEKKKNLKNSFEKLKEDERFKKMLTYDGVNLWCVFKELLVYLYRFQYIKTISQIELIKQMIAQERPQLIIGFENPSLYTNLLLETAKNANIKTLLIPHATLFFEQPYHCQTPATKIAVYGQQRKNVLIKTGINPNKIVLLGQPEPVSSFSSQNREKIFKQLGISKGKKLIVFPSTGHSEEVVGTALNKIYSAMKSFPDLQFVVKVHPPLGGLEHLYDRHVQMHKKLIDKYGVENAMVVTRIKLEELLAASDFVINLFSTVGVEAMVLGKPVIHLAIGGFPKQYFPKQILNKMEIVKTKAELIECIEKLLQCPASKLEKRFKKLGQFFIYQRGEPVYKHINNLIDKMLKET